MLSGIRGLRLHIASVAAKFKYDGHNPQEHRAQVAGRLESRGSGRDRSAAVQQRWRLREIGEWNPATNRGAAVTADQRGGQAGGRVAGHPWA
jgi:transcriptional regulator